MVSLIASIVGAVLGLAIHIGIVYYLVANTSEDQKSPALAAVLSVIFGPIIGFAYARPEAWGSGIVVELGFAAPLAGGIAVLAAGGNVVIAGVLGLYAVVALIVTAALMAQDQNEHVEMRKAASE